MPELSNGALWDHELSFSHTVARELVHKAAIEQVLLADHCKVEDAFLCSGQLPRTHRFYSDSTSDCYDPLLLLEAARQAGVLVSHCYLGVPDSFGFIFARLQLDYLNRQAARIGREPAELHIHLGFSESRRRRGVIAGGRMHAHVYVDRVHVLDTWGDLTYVSAGAYRALRGHARRGRGHELAPAVAPERVQPGEVARTNPQNVVVGPLSSPPGGVPSTSVVVDECHATFFDHPVDHVPGVLLIEALRQSALLAGARAMGVSAERLLLCRAETSYEVFAELDVPIVCTIRQPSLVGSIGSEETLTVELHLEQGSQRLAWGSFELTEQRNR